MPLLAELKERQVFLHPSFLEDVAPPFPYVVVFWMEHPMRKIVLTFQQQQITREKAVKIVQVTWYPGHGTTIDYCFHLHKESINPLRA